ncbi:MAG: hypothetical protein ACP5LB_07310 [Candidatus Bathyarchaeia archaeon]
MALGFFENFPENVHETAAFTTTLSCKRLQQTLIQTLSKLNGKNLRLEEAADPSIPQCTIIFEFGIAEANSFTYLGDDEMNKVLKAISNKPFQVVDVYCAVRYYRWQNEKKTPLRFDYYMLRFIFGKRVLETLVFHERGPRYVTPNDIINFITNKVNEAFSKKVLRPLTSP